MQGVWYGRRGILREKRRATGEKKVAARHFYASTANAVAV